MDASDVATELSHSSTVDEDNSATGGQEEKPGSSALFRIEIQGLPHSVNYSKMKHLVMTKMNLNPHKIHVTSMKKFPQYIFATFECEEAREEAIKTINNFVWKGQTLSAKKLNPVADPLERKRSAEQNVHSEDAKRSRNDMNTEEGQADDDKAESHEKRKLPVSVMVRNTVTPMWHLSYSVQLKEKRTGFNIFMKKLTRRLKHENPQLIPADSQTEGNSFCCPVLPIIGSPEMTGFCNRCKFDVGLDPESDLPTVGFCITNSKQGITGVAEGSHCSHIPEVMHKAVQMFQEYIRGSSKAVFNPETQEGYWRQLTVRTGHKQYLLIVVVLHPQNLTEVEISEEKMKLSNFFLNSDLKVTSLYLKRFLRKGDKKPCLEHIWGGAFIEEELLGQTLRISHDSFFRANTLGAQLLYTTVRDFASLTKETILLDLWCGTGAIGLSLAKCVKKVIGVELCQAAVDDAQHNAQANGIDNAEFICGKVENILMNVFKKCGDSEDIVAVLDPPKACLPSKVMKMIRLEDKLKRFVFLSSSPQVHLNNFIDFCRPVSNNYRGCPFRPTKAVPIDLFPLTKQWDFVVLFERK